MTLALWIDAGTLDADNASVANMAAWIAARRALATPRVTPNVTGIIVTRESIIDAVELIRVALSAREATDDEMELAWNAVRPNATSNASDSEALAMRAALDRPAGSRERPAREAIETFWRSHYGVERALVTVLGSESELDAIRSLDGIHAERTRRTRSFPDSGAATVDEDLPEGESPAWAIVLSMPSETEAFGMAERIRDRRSWAPGVEVSAFPLEGGWWTLVHAPATRASEVANWLRPGRSGRVPPREESPADWMYRTADAWAAEPRLEHAHRVGMAWMGRVDPEARAAVQAALEGEPLTESNFVEVGSDAVVVAAVAPRTTASAGGSVLAFDLLSVCRGRGQLTVDAWGPAWTVEGTAADVASEVSLWLDCVRSHRPTESAFEQIKRARLATARVEDEYLVLIGEAIRPDDVVRIAHEASFSRLGATTYADVLTAWEDWTLRATTRFAGSRTSLAELTSLRLPAGSTDTSTGALTGPRPPAVGTDHVRIAGLTTTESLRVWDIPASVPERVLAELTRRASATSQATWHRWGRLDGQAWIALVSRAPPETLAEESDPSVAGWVTQARQDQLSSRGLRTSARAIPPPEADLHSLQGALNRATIRTIVLEPLPDALRRR